MLAIQKPSEKRPECTPNLLPARLNHNGPVNATERYWSPETRNNGGITSFFRGRKLKGRSVKIPEGYKGVVLDITDNPAPQTRKEEHEEGGVDAEDDEEDDEKLVDIMAVEELASFEEIVVWNHQFTPAETEDPYVRGVQEWMGLAEAMHCEEDDTTATPTNLSS